MNIVTSTPIWIALVAVVGALAGVGIAFYLPVWVLMLLTIIMALVSIASLFDLRYFGCAWVIMFGVTVFTIPLWVAWFLVTITELTRGLQSFP